MKLMMLLGLFFFSVSRAETLDTNQLAFNANYEELRSLLQTRERRQAAELGKNMITLAESIYDESSSQLADFYLLVNSLVANEIMFNRSLGDVGLARRSLLLNRQVYGEGSEQEIRGHASLLKIIFYGRIDDKQEEFKKARLSALSAVKEIQTKEVADLYVLLSSLGFSTKSARKRYADIGADMYSEVLGESSYEALQARVGATRFLPMSKQISEIKKLIPLFQSDERSLRMRAAMHQKLSVLYLRKGEDELSMEQNLLAYTDCKRLGENSDIDAASYMPILKENPAYPRKAQRKGIEGYVVLEYTVSKEGFVKNPTVVDSNAPGIFDKAALDAAQKYRYLPMIVSGVPIDVPGVKTRITFEMADN